MDPNRESEVPIDYSPHLLSLRELGLINVARCLLNSQNVRADLRYHFFGGLDKAKSVTSSLPLSSSLIKGLLGAIRHVGKQLFKWIEPFQIRNYRFATKDTFDEWEREIGWGRLVHIQRGHTFHRDNFDEWPNRIRREYILNYKVIWSAYGTVDSARMARLVLRDETIPVEDRFILSCNLCLEDEVARLWIDVSPEYKDAESHSSLVCYWINRMLGKTYDHRSHDDFRYVHPLQSVPSRAEEFFIEELRLSPAINFQYNWFWPLLDDAEKARQLTIFQKKDMLGNDYGFFLLNQLNLQQQKEFFASPSGNPEWNLFEMLNIHKRHAFFRTLNLIGRKSLIRFAELFHIEIYAKNVFLATECDEEMRDRVMAALAERDVYPNTYLSECACKDDNDKCSYCIL